MEKRETLPPSFRRRFSQRPTKGRRGRRVSLKELYRHVTEREGVDIETARIDASAVMRVLREAVTPGELDDVMMHLPEDFNTLLR